MSLTPPDAWKVAHAAALPVPVGAARVAHGCGHLQPEFLCYVLTTHV